MRLYCVILALVLVFATAIAGVRQVGSATPSPIVGMFNAPDGSLCKERCLFGIRPGETTAKEALAMLMAHPMTRSLTVLNKNPLLMGNPQSGMFIDIENTPDGVVQGIVLSLGTSPGSGAAPGVHPSTTVVSLGDAVAIWGRPTLTADVESGNVQIAFTNAPIGLIVQTHQEQRFETSAWLNAAILYSMPACAANQIFYSGVAWLGFASSGRYRHAPTIDIPLMPGGGVTAGSANVICR